MGSKKLSSPHQKRLAAATKQPLFYGSPAATRVSVKNSSDFVVLEETLKGYASYFTQFGIADFHARGVLGKGVSIVIIDCGLVYGKSELLQNVSLVNLRKNDEGKDSGQHGIAVASLVAGTSASSTRTGVAPEAGVTLIDVDETDGEIKLSSVLQALSHALSLKPDIVNISLGTDTADDALHAAIAALIAEGILVFAAAGNSGIRVYEYPAACPGVICVGSMNASGVPSTFNSRNDTVTVFAPGERTTQNSVADSFALTSLDGTSFASPFAAALLALHLSEQRQKSSSLAPVTIQRDEAILFLRQALRDNCSTHLYVQERFSDFGCADMEFMGQQALISAPTCANQFRMAVFWFAVTVCLAGTLALVLLGRTEACMKICKVVFTGKK
jgi:subtilisin family serine protease